MEQTFHKSISKP